MPHRWSASSCSRGQRLRLPRRTRVEHGSQGFAAGPQVSLTSQAMAGLKDMCQFARVVKGGGLKIHCRQLRVGSNATADRATISAVSCMHGSPHPATPHLADSASLTAQTIRGAFADVGQAPRGMAARCHTGGLRPAAVGDRGYDCLEGPVSNTGAKALLRAHRCP